MSRGINNMMVALVAAVVVLVAVGNIVECRARRASTGASVNVDKDGCHMECSKNGQASSGKHQRDGSGNEGQNCRWILRTDGKSARLCEPNSKCKRVCPNGQQKSNDDDMRASSERIEQQTEPIGSMSSGSGSSSGGGGQVHGIMQHKYGSKLKQAPVPGVSGGRLSSASAGNSNGGSSSNSGQQASNGRQMAPTLAPESINYDDTADTPPPIARFLDISPEE